MFRVFIIMAIELALPTREERWLILTNLSYVVGFKEGGKRRREKRVIAIFYMAKNALSLTDFPLTRTISVAIRP